MKVASQAGIPYPFYVSAEVFGRLHFSLTSANGVPLIWDPWKWEEKDKWLWRTSWWFGPESVKQVPVSPPPSPNQTGLVLKKRTLGDLVGLKPAIPNFGGPFGPAMRSLADLAKPPEPSIWETLAKISAAQPSQASNPFYDPPAKPDSLKGLDAIIAALLASEKKK